MQAIHQRLTVMAKEPCTCTADRLTDQEGLPGCTGIHSRGMELHKGHVTQWDTGPNGHCNAIACGRGGVGGVLVYLTHTACGQHDEVGL